MLHDLTSRMNLEERARRQRGAVAAIIDSAVDGIVVIDAHGRIEASIRRPSACSAITADEVLGHNVDMLMPSPYREEHDTYLSRYLATGRAKIIGIGREVQGRRKDGSTFPLHLSVGQITIERRAKFTGILHDLSARVQLEEQLREQAALAQLGEMAAVIAHEVKNPLAGIRGAIQVIEQRLAHDGTTHAGPEGDRRADRLARTDDEGPAALRAAAQAETCADRRRPAGRDHGAVC